MSELVLERYVYLDKYICYIFTADKDFVKEAKPTNPNMSRSNSKYANVQPEEEIITYKFVSPAKKTQKMVGVLYSQPSLATSNQFGLFTWNKYINILRSQFYILYIRSHDGLYPKICSKPISNILLRSFEPTIWNFCLRSYDSQIDCNQLQINSHVYLVIVMYVTLNMRWFYTTLAYVQHILKYIVLLVGIWIWLSRIIQYPQGLSKGCNLYIYIYNRLRASLNMYTSHYEALVFLR